MRSTQHRIIALKQMFRGTVTQTLKTALALVDVRVRDHLAVAGAEARSFAELGLL